MATNNFFFSSKNLVGMGLATAALVGGAATGVAALPLAVAGAAAWGAGVALTPQQRQNRNQSHTVSYAAPSSNSSSRFFSSEPAPVAVPQQPITPTDIQLRESLSKTSKNLLRASPPREVTERMETLANELRFCLDEWSDLQHAPQHQQTIWNIIEIYLPEVIHTYLDAPQYRSPEAVAVMNDSLGTLTKAAGRIKDAILDDNLRAMDSQARTLRETFGDLPGLDTGYSGDAVMDEYDGRS